MATPDSSQNGAAPAPPSDFARRTGLVSLATLLSRILGLVREQLFALTLGATAQADAALLAATLSEIDRAAKKGAIHRNAAARHKSRLTRKLNAARV